ncbi:MAG: hypothetical protein MUO82_03590 [Candidatus Thermoplasmatota archaeon]|nr:hypothetical protein [Candidatus Thermoplasmatota archaeon]
MMKLYGEDIQVFFFDDKSNFGGIKAMFRNKGDIPYGIDVSSLKTTWDSTKCNISYNDTLFSERCLSPVSWKAMVHEVTHYKIGMETNKKPLVGGYSRYPHHPRKFWNSYQRNQRKVKVLQEQFYGELETTSY